MPVWQLDTTNYIVTHYNEETYEVETTPFHAECVRYHIDSIRTKNVDILKDMVSKGKILILYMLFHVQVGSYYNSNQLVLIHYLQPESLN